MIVSLQVGGKTQTSATVARNKPRITLRYSVSFWIWILCDCEDMVPRPLPRGGVQPLLSMVGGKPRDGAAKPVKEPEDVYALPMDSSDEEVTEQPLAGVFADSSDDDGPSRRADIVPTKFETRTAPKKPAADKGRQNSAKDEETASENLDLTPKRRSTRQPATKSATRKRSLEDIEDDESEHTNGHASYKKTKTPAKKSVTAVGDHMQPGWLVESSIERRAKGPKAGYGKKAAKARVSTPSEKFKTHKIDFSSPEKASTFKTIHFNSDDTSPVSDLKLPKQSRKKRKSKGTPQLPELQMEESPEKPEFKMPKGFDKDARKSNFASFDMSLDETPADEKRALGPGLRLCPMCGEVVDEEGLEEFSKGQRMTIARQSKFCLAHKKKSAQKAWEDLGYPDIDWKKLGKRIADHHDFIESLIRGASSHFGTLHEEKIKSGKNRTIFKTEEYPTPGYYGLRGMSIMTETLVETFSSLLRERAPSDNLISARGYTAYVQSVLVPELAVRLIQEDMGDITAAEARNIMANSRAIGELLNDESPESQPKRNTRQQVTKKTGGSSQREKTSEKRKAAKNGQKEVLEDSICLKIQTIVDSDSELSSLDSVSMDDGNTIDALLPGKTQAVEKEDSDSDLTSLEDF